jgi:type IV secretory pathway TrbL component
MLQIRPDRAGSQTGDFFSGHAQERHSAPGLAMPPRSGGSAADIRDGAATAFRRRGSDAVAMAMRRKQQRTEDVRSLLLLAQALCSSCAADATGYVSGR